MFPKQFKKEIMKRAKKLQTQINKVKGRLSTKKDHWRNGATLREVEVNILENEVEALIWVLDMIYAEEKAEKERQKRRMNEIHRRSDKESVR